MPGPNHPRFAPPTASGDDPAQAAINDQQPCLPTPGGDDTPTKVYLAYLEQDGWTFNVMLHPEMKIEITGNPTWQQVCGHFQVAIRQIEEDMVRRTINRIADIAPRGETKAQWCRRIKLALEQADEAQQAATDSGTARMDMPGEAEDARDSDDPIGGLPDIGDIEDHGRDDGAR